MSVRDRASQGRDDMVIAALHALAPSLDGEPDADFQAKTRARLVAMAAVRTAEPAPASGLQRLLAVRAPDVAPVRWRSRLTAGLAGAALTVTALASLVAVADGAQPGDVLYDLKRGTEQTQLALAGDARGQTLLDFASTRLDEVESLVAEEGTALPATPAGSGDASVSAAGADAGLVLETLQTMDEQTTEGAAWFTDRAVDTGEADPLDDLAQWASAQSGELAALQPLVPEEAAEAVAKSLVLLGQIGVRTDGLQPALACAGGPAVAGSDDLGPLPAPCSVPEPAPPVTNGGSTDPGTTTVPEAGTPGGTTPALPTDPQATVPGTGGGSGGLPTPAVPTPTPGGGLVPSLPLPSLSLPGNSGGAGSSSSPVIKVPPVGPITICLPPLATVGDC